MTTRTFLKKSAIGAGLLAWLSTFAFAQTTSTAAPVASRQKHHRQTRSCNAGGFTEAARASDSHRL